MQLLVVEDELSMGDILRQGLDEANHTVVLARDGQEALAALAATTFDAVVLDVLIPAPTGLEVVRRLRADGNQVPILLLTALDASRDVVSGLDAGADDYLVKPFAFAVLLARLRAIARRGATLATPLLQADDLIVDPASRDVTRAGHRIHVTATEFRVLECLLRRAGRACSRAAIIEAVWGFEEDVEPNTIDTYVKILRDKVDHGRDRKLIHTVRGYGYIIRES